MKNQPILITTGYKKALLAFSIIISIPSVFLLIIAISKLNYIFILLWGGVLALSWFLYSSIKSNNKTAFWFSLVTISMLWLLMLLRTFQRAYFIIENGGMERADGYGSPLAFLIGLAGEQLFFLPASVVVLIGWKMIYNLLKNNIKS